MPKTADYQSYCPIARGLDLLGDRWTLLIMRELTSGERRFTDLRTALPGIPPNILSQRLKDLTADGLVETRELPPPAARMVYAATDYGMTTIPVLRALSRFGFSRLEPADEHTPLRPAMAVNSSVRAFYDPAAVGELDQRYVLVVDGTSLEVATRKGGASDPGAPADLTLTLPAWVLIELRSGRLTFEDAEAQGLLVRDGKIGALRNLRRVFRFP